MKLRGKLTLFAKIALVTGGMAFMLNSVKAEGTIINEARERKTYEELSEQAFIESIDAYDSYVSAIADIMKNTCDYDNPIAVFATYLEMIDSKDITFGSKNIEKNSIDIPGYWGMNVITGESSCRHHADNLSRILNKLEIESGIVLGEMFDSEKPTNNPNHAVVFVKYEGDVILLDPANKTIFVKGDKYYETVDSEYKFVPSLSCDQVYGFANNNIPSYFNLVDISDKKEFYKGLLDLFKEVAYEQRDEIHLSATQSLREYQTTIFKELIHYQTLYGVVADRLGEGASEGEIIEGVLDNYETMDEIHKDYEELIESGYKPSM